MIQRSDIILILPFDKRAEDWHKDLEGAIWQSKHNMETLKAAIPLTRVTNFSLSNLMDFTQIYALDIDRSNANQELPSMTFRLGLHLTESANFEKCLQDHLERAALHRKSSDAASLRRLTEAVLDLADPTEGLDGAELDAISLSGSKNNSREEKLKYRIKKEFALDCEVDDMYGEFIDSSKCAVQI